jgi:hypothetical protein
VAEVLLYGGLGELEATGYVGVAQALHYELQDLPTTRGQNILRLGGSW